MALFEIHWIKPGEAIRKRNKWRPRTEDELRSWLSYYEELEAFEICAEIRDELKIRERQKVEPKWKT